MRLVVAVLPDHVAGRVTRGLTDDGFACTRIASSGDFLEEGHTTLMVGVPQRQVDQVLRVIRCTTTPGDGVAFVLPAQAANGMITALQPAAALGKR